MRLLNSGIVHFYKKLSRHGHSQENFRSSTVRAELDFTVGDADEQALLLKT